MEEENITVHIKWEQRFLKQPHALFISDKSNPNDLNLNVPDSQTSTARPSENPPLSNFDKYVTKKNNIFNGAQFLLEASQLEWGVRWHLSGFDHYRGLWIPSGLFPEQLQEMAELYGASRLSFLSHQFSKAQEQLKTQESILISIKQGYLNAQENLTRIHDCYQQLTSQPLTVRTPTLLRQ